MNLTKTGVWSIIGLSDGYCAVTIVLVSLLAFLAGGYLIVTAQYGIAIGLTVTAFGIAYWVYQQGSKCSGERV